MDPKPRDRCTGFGQTALQEPHSGEVQMLTTTTTIIIIIIIIITIIIIVLLIIIIILILCIRSILHSFMISTIDSSV